MQSNKPRADRCSLCREPKKVEMHAECLFCRRTLGINCLVNCLQCSDKSAEQQLLLEKHYLSKLKSVLNKGIDDKSISQTEVAFYTQLASDSRDIIEKLQSCSPQNTDNNLSGDNVISSHTVNVQNLTVGNSLPKEVSQRDPCLPQGKDSSQEACNMLLKNSLILASPAKPNTSNSKSCTVVDHAIDNFNESSPSCILPAAPTQAPNAAINCNGNEKDAQSHCKSERKRPLNSTPCSEAKRIKVESHSSNQHSLDITGDSNTSEAAAHNDFSPSKVLLVSVTKLTSEVTDMCLRGEKTTVVNTALRSPGRRNVNLFESPHAASGYLLEKQSSSGVSRSGLLQKESPSAGQEDISKHKVFVNEPCSFEKNKKRKSCVLSPNNAAVPKHINEKCSRLLKPSCSRDIFAGSSHPAEKIEDVENLPPKLESLESSVLSSSTYGLSNEKDGSSTDHDSDSSFRPRIVCFKSLKTSENVISTSTDFKVCDLGVQKNLENKDDDDQDDWLGSDLVWKHCRKKKVYSFLDKRNLPKRKRKHTSKKRASEDGNSLNFTPKKSTKFRPTMSRKTQKTISRKRKRKASVTVAAAETFPRLNPLKSKLTASKIMKCVSTNKKRTKGSKVAKKKKECVSSSKKATKLTACKTTKRSISSSECVSNRAVHLLKCVSKRSVSPSDVKAKKSIERNENSESLPNSNRSPFRIQKFHDLRTNKPKLITTQDTNLYEKNNVNDASCSREDIPKLPIHKSVNVAENIFSSCKSSLKLASFKEIRIKTSMETEKKLPASEYERRALENSVPCLLMKKQPKIILHKLTSSEILLPISKLEAKLMEANTRSKTVRSKGMLCETKRPILKPLQCSQDVLPIAPRTKNLLTNRPFDLNEAVRNHSSESLPEFSIFPQGSVKLPCLNLSDNIHLTRPVPHSVGDSLMKINKTSKDCTKKVGNKQLEINERAALEQKNIVKSSNIGYNLRKKPTTATESTVKDDNLTMKEELLDRVILPGSKSACKSPKSPKPSFSGDGGSVDASGFSLESHSLADGKAVTQPGPEYIASDCIDGGRDSPPEADGNTSVCKASSIDDDTNKALLSTHMRQRLIKLYNKKRLHQSPARFFSPIKSPKKSVNVVSNRSVAQRFLFRHVNNLVPISGRVNEHDQYSDESYVPECESDQESDLDINDEFPCPALMVEVQIESGVSQNQSSLSGTESKIPVTAIAAMSTSVPLCVTRRNSSQPKKQDLKSQSPEASFDSDAVQETISNHMESVCDGIEGKSHDQDTNEDNVSTVCASKTGEASAVVLSKTVPPSCSTCCTSTRKLVESSNDPQILKANLTSNSNPEASGRSKRDNNCSRVYDQCKFGRGTGSLFEESSLSSSASARNSFKETTLDKETSVSKISLPIDVPVTDSGLASGHLLEADKCPSESQNSSLTSTTISDVHSSLPAHENYSMEILSKSDDHDNSEAPPTKHAHVSDLCDENFSSQPSSNPTTENADSTTVMIDKPVESLIDQFHDLKSNEFHSSLCSKNKSISSAPSSTLIANSELLKDHQPASSPSKKQMVELASTPEDVMSRSTRYSQLTGQPVVRLPLLTINDDSLEKLRMQGVKPCSVVSAFERLHRAEHLRSEVPDLSAEFAYFHVHQIFSAVIPKKYRKSNLFRCMLAHLTSLLRHGRLDGSFLDFEVVNHTYMGKIYCAWVKPVDSSELRDETQDASSSRTLALKGTTPADEGVTPADEGTTPADEGATPADEGATPANEKCEVEKPGDWEKSCEIKPSQPGKNFEIEKPRELEKSCAVEKLADFRKPIEVEALKPIEVEASMEIDELNKKDKHADLETPTEVDQFLEMGELIQMNRSIPQITQQSSIGETFSRVYCKATEAVAEDTTKHVTDNSSPVGGDLRVHDGVGIVAGVPSSRLVTASALHNAANSWFSEKPSLENEKTSLESETPSLESETPSLESEKPSLESDKPSLESDKPSLESDKPSLESEKPSLESEKPSLESEKPSLESERPSLESERPSLESERPSLESERPSLESEKLSLEVDNPNLEVKKPNFEDEKSCMESNNPLLQVESQLEWIYSTSEGKALFLSPPPDCFLLPLTDTQVLLGQSRSASEVVSTPKKNSSDRKVKNKFRRRRDTFRKSEKRPLLNSSAETSKHNPPGKHILSNVFARDMHARSCKTNSHLKITFVMNEELSTLNKITLNSTSSCKDGKLKEMKLLKRKRVADDASLAESKSELNKIRTITVKQTKQCEPRQVISHFSRAESKQKLVNSEMKKFTLEERSSFFNPDYDYSSTKNKRVTLSYNNGMLALENQNCDVRNCREVSTSVTSSTSRVTPMDAGVMTSTVQTAREFGSRVRASTINETLARTDPRVFQCLLPLCVTYQSCVKAKLIPSDRRKTSETSISDILDSSHGAVITAKCKWHYEYLESRLLHMNMALEMSNATLTTYDVHSARRVQNLYFEWIQFLKIHKYVLEKFMMKYNVDSVRFKCLYPSAAAATELQNLISCHEKATAKFEKQIHSFIENIVSTRTCLLAKSTTEGSSASLRSSSDSQMASCSHTSHLNSLSSSTMQEKSLLLESEVFTNSRKELPSAIEDPTVQLINKDRNSIFPISVPTSAVCVSSNSASNSHENLDFCLSSAWSEMNRSRPTLTKRTAIVVSHSKKKNLPNKFNKESAGKRVGHPPSDNSSFSASTLKKLLPREPIPKVHETPVSQLISCTTVTAATRVVDPIISTPTVQQLLSSGEDAMARSFLDAPRDPAQSVPHIPVSDKGPPITGAPSQIGVDLNQQSRGTSVDGLTHCPQMSGNSQNSGVTLGSSQSPGLLSNESIALMPRGVQLPVVTASKDARNCPIIMFVPTTKKELSSLPGSACPNSYVSTNSAAPSCQQIHSVDQSQSNLTSKIYTRFPRTLEGQNGQVDQRPSGSQSEPSNSSKANIRNPAIQLSSGNADCLVARSFVGDVGSLKGDNPVDKSAALPCSILKDLQQKTHRDTDLHLKDRPDIIGLNRHCDVPTQTRQLVTSVKPLNFVNSQSCTRTSSYSHGSRSSNRASTLQLSCPPLIENKFNDAQRNVSSNRTSSLSLSNSDANYNQHSAGSEKIPCHTLLSTYTPSISQSQVKTPALYTTPNSDIQGHYSCRVNAARHSSLPQKIIGRPVASRQPSSTNISVPNLGVHPTGSPDSALNDSIGKNETFVGGPKTMPCLTDHIQGSNSIPPSRGMMTAAALKSCENDVHASANLNNLLSVVSQSEMNSCPNLTASSIDSPCFSMSRSDAQSDALRGSFSLSTPVLEKRDLIDLIDRDSNECIIPDLFDNNQVLDSLPNRNELDTCQVSSVENIEVDCSEANCEKQDAIVNDESNDEDDPFGFVWKGNVEDSKPVDKMYAGSYQSTKYDHRSAVNLPPSKKRSVYPPKIKKATARKSSAMRNNQMRLSMKNISMAEKEPMSTVSMEFIVPESTSNFFASNDVIAYTNPPLETTSKQPPHASSQINTFEKSSYISSSSLKLSPEILDALNLKTKNLIVNGYVKESKSTGSLFPPETPFAKRRTSVIYVRYVKPFVPVSSERRMLVVRSLPQKLSNVAPQLSSSFVNSPVIASQLPQLPVNSTATSQILRLPLNSNAVLARRNAPNRNSVKVIRAFMFNPESGNSFVRAPTTNFGSALPERFSTLQTSSIQEIPGLRPNFSIPQSSNLPRSPPPPYSEAVQHPPPYYYSNQIRSFQTNYRNYAPRPIIAPSLLTRGHFVNDPNAGSTPNQGRTSFKYIRLDTNAHSDNTVNTIPSVSAFKPSGQIITSDL